MANGIMNDKNSCGFKTDFDKKLTRTNLGLILLHALLYCFRKEKLTQIMQRKRNRQSNSNVLDRDTM